MDAWGVACGYKREGSQPPVGVRRAEWIFFCVTVACIRHGGALVVSELLWFILVQDQRTLEEDPYLQNHDSEESYH